MINRFTIPSLIITIRACPRLFFVSRIHFHKLRMYSHNLIYSIVLVHFITAVSVRYIRPIILFQNTVIVYHIIYYLSSFSIRPRGINKKVNILLNFSTSERFKNQGYISICIAPLKRLYGFTRRLFYTKSGGKIEKKRD